MGGGGQAYLGIFPKLFTFSYDGSPNLTYLREGLKKNGLFLTPIKKVGRYLTEITIS